LDQTGGNLTDTGFLVSLFPLALEDGLLGLRLGQGYGAAMHALDFAVAGQRIQITPGGGLADVERGAYFRHADALLADY